MFESSFNIADETALRKRLAAMIARRAGSGGAGARRAAAASVVYGALAAVLVPLVSEAGFDALVARAFDLAQREYPAGTRIAASSRETDRFVEIGRWLDRQEQRVATDAAAALFAAVAGLLIPLIGESLTTQYLAKAWPEGFTARRTEERRA